jgi:hypothetical protein
MPTKVIITQFSPDVVTNPGEILDVHPGSICVLCESLYF